MLRNALIIAISGLLLLGCQYHYTLKIVAQPAPSQALAPLESPETLETPRALENSPEPFKAAKPLSISPGDFQASQTQGGAMVNVLINLNLLKPTSVSTDAAAQLSGIPGL